ncbi:hydroxyisourate hydrolase [Streptomyces sp. NPDC127069]|uniref:hydroxyisourate hydrolase n=1 Tax=Streptomyces sp. NPDC127069 TaxID=3347128 RepID=UPI003664D511
MEDALTLSVHVHDAVHGGLIAGIPVHLEHQNGQRWHTLLSGITNERGSCAHTTATGPETGTYRWVLATGDYYRTLGIRALHPEISIAFTVAEAVPRFLTSLVISPHSYTTYRGF